MERYSVKNKYTYERVWQKDFSYSDRKKTSDNIIEGRYIYRTGELIGKGSAKIGVSVETELTAEQSRALAGASGICVSASATQAGICRVVFFGEGGESFMSVSEFCEGDKKAYFSTLKMKFAPRKMLVETDTEQNTDVSVSAACVLNPLGEWGGQSGFYSAVGGNVRDEDKRMILTLRGRTELCSPEFPDRSDTVCNMLMPRRNTVLFIIGNHSTASVAKLCFTTYEHTGWSEEASVSVPLLSDSEPHAYYFNLSESTKCSGRLKSFRLVLDGEGEIVIYRYSFEQEKPVRKFPGEILSCLADTEKSCVEVKGVITSEQTLGEYAGGKVRVYAATMEDEGDTPQGKALVGECDIAKEFCIENTELYSGNVSRLSTQFAAFVEFDGKEPVQLCERFYIENYEVFDSNPYSFYLPEYSVSVLDFGAKGDAYTNDTDAIQAAIDHVSAAGGGRVVVPGESGIYGRRYIVTNILMRPRVDLHLCEGAILWQSQVREDYTYRVTYGHDGIIPGINWTHNMHVSNLPLIQAANAHHVKITGHGKLRGMDIGSEEGVDMHMRYSSGCPDRIHLIMIGFFDTKFVECRDFEIVRCNNYHTAFYHCSDVYMANLKFHEVKCLSGDGIGIMIGTHDVTVNRCFVQSNDDYLVLVSVYSDPRGILWWTNTDDTHCGPYNITMRHCFVNAGTGGGVAFITWGTNDTVQERAEICGIRIYDNYFDGQKGIGGWFDNPYNGKVPFDNLETDDYSPVRDVRILNNRYTDFVTLGPVKATDFISDCGLHSHSDFVNGNFVLGGLANWTAFKNSNPDSVKTIIYCNKEKGCIDCFDCGDTALAQGLYIDAGRYEFECELMTGEDGAELYVLDIQGGETLHSERFVCCCPKTIVKTAFELDRTRDVYVGVRSASRNKDGFAVIDSCRIFKI